MGTNFYWHSEPPKGCEHCGHAAEAQEILHIGKSSAGWCFSLHVIPEKAIFDLENWEAYFSIPGSVIRDEYGEVRTKDEMLHIITKRGTGDKKAKLGKWWEPYYKSEDDFHEKNHSAPCELDRTLVRHKIGNHCVGHGSGTWDLIEGDFS